MSFEPHADPKSVAAMLAEFDPDLSVEDGMTPPASWYVDPQFYRGEIDRVFQRCWIPVGLKSQVDDKGDYFTCDIGGNPLVVARGQDDIVYGHHNVCRHKGAVIADEEDQTQHSCEVFRCPYHGWEYELDGSLKKAPMLGKKSNFKAADNGLQPVSVDQWGPYVFVDLDGPAGGAGNPRDLHADLEPIKQPLEELGFESLRFYKRFSYDLDCNWKVFVDNSLDGGYHVYYAHESLAEGLDMKNFQTHIYERTSLQICDAKGEDKRLGSRVLYAYLFPNLFINRYGNMMDVNIVMPIGPDKCRIHFDFFFDYENPNSWDNRRAVRKSIASSHTIQQEDIEICESAQRGMKSIAFNRGHYSSQMEQAVHAFHVLLWNQMQEYAPTRPAD